MVFDVKMVSTTAYRREQFALNQGSSSSCVDQMPEMKKKWASWRKPLHKLPEGSGLTMLFLLLEWSFCPENLIFHSNWRLLSFTKSNSTNCNLRSGRFFFSVRACERSPLFASKSSSTLKYRAKCKTKDKIPLFHLNVFGLQ